MDAPLGFGFRHALHAVPAGFKLQLTVHAVAGNFGNHFFETAVFAFVGAHHLDTPAAAFRIAAVHAEQIAGKDRRLIAAGAGAHFEEAAALVIRIFRQQQHLQLLLQRFTGRPRLFQLFLRHLAHFRIVQHHFRRLQILLHLTPFQEAAADVGQLRVFSRQRAEPVLLGDDAGIAEQRLHFFMALL